MKKYYAWLVALVMVAAMPTWSEEKNLSGKWQSKFTLGGSTQNGNTKAASLNADFISKRATKKHQTVLSAQYAYGRNEGKTNANNSFIQGQHDWLFSGPWSLFGRVRGDYDRFNSWEYRAGGHAGIGYFFYRSDTFTLSSKVGFGATRNFRPQSDWMPEALIGAEMDWSINALQKLRAYANYYPNLDDKGEFRLINGITWTYQLKEKSPFSLSIALLHEHQSVIQPGRQKNDFRTVLGLSYAF